MFNFGRPNYFKSAGENVQWIADVLLYVTINRDFRKKVITTFVKPAVMTFFELNKLMKELEEFRGIGRKDK